MLDAVMAAFGRPVTYQSPDGMMTLGPLTGALIRTAVALDSDAENTGGIPQWRDLLRMRDADFPAGVGPEQGAYVVVYPDGTLHSAILAGTAEGEPSLVADVLTDRRGWHDLALAAAPE